MASPVHLTKDTVLRSLSPDRPVLIAGPTASGKSSLALQIAQAQGGTIVNADASQVYTCWRVLTARPDATEEQTAPHRLYGHVDARTPYSTGHWLREVKGLLGSSQRLIIVGGTGLYFTALTNGLVDIPTTPDAIRTEGNRLSVDDMLGDLDPLTRTRIDTLNRARVQRAWEVLRATGRGLASWQDATDAPLLPLSAAQGIVVDAPKDWLNPRIEKRFECMLDAGALDEVRAVLPDYDPALPAHRAIGAPELVAALRNEMTLEEAKSRAVIATRQFAKRQRTWFRSRMDTWSRFQPAS